MPALCARSNPTSITFDFLRFPFRRGWKQVCNDQLQRVVKSWCNGVSPLQCAPLAVLAARRVMVALQGLILEIDDPVLRDVVRGVVDQLFGTVVGERVLATSTINGISSGSPSSKSDPLPRKMAKSGSETLRQSRGNVDWTWTD